MGEYIDLQVGGIPRLQAISGRDDRNSRFKISGTISLQSIPKPPNASATPPKNRSPCWSASSRPAATPATWCSTPSAAAAPPSPPPQKLGRRWIGIDITHLAIALIKYRLKDMFPELPVRGHRRAARPGLRPPAGPGRPLPVPVVGALAGAAPARSAARPAASRARRAATRASTA